MYVCVYIYRYEMGDFFNWHEDALPLEEVEGNVANGGVCLSVCLSVSILCVCMYVCVCTCGQWRCVSTSVSIWYVCMYVCTCLCILLIRESGGQVKLANVSICVC